MAGYTRTVYREEIAQYFNGNVPLTNTATGGTTTTVVDSRLARFADDYFINADIFIKTDAGGAHAAPEGEWSTCTDFAASTGTLTVSPAFTAAPAAGDTFQIYLRTTKANIDRAIARACYGATAILSLTPSTVTLDYALSVSGLVHPGQITAVWRRDAASVTTQPYRITGWQVEDNAGTLTLRLAEMPYSNDQLWVEYRIDENGMATDAATCVLPISLVRARAIVWLLENILSTQDANGLDRWGTLLRDMREQLAREEHKHQPEAGRARVYPWRKRSTRSGEDVLGLTPYDYLLLEE